MDPVLAPRPLIMQGLQIVLGLTLPELYHLRELLHLLQSVPPFMPVLSPDIRRPQPIHFVKRLVRNLHNDPSDIWLETPANRLTELSLLRERLRTLMTEDLIPALVHLPSMLLLRQSILYRVLGPVRG